MGQTLWILTGEKEVDDWDHSTVLDELKYLDTLCEQSGTEKLSAYIDESIAAEEFGIEMTPKYVDANTLYKLLTLAIEQADKGTNTMLVEELQDIQTKCLQAKDSKVRLAIVP